jgi:hypothetical protein
MTKGTPAALAVAPGRHVAARDLHRHQPLSRDDAGRELDLEVAHAGALGFGEAAHPIHRVVDVPPQAIGHFARAAIRFLGGDKDLAMPVVELRGVVPHGGLAMRGDGGEHRLHNRAGLGCGVLGGAARALQVFDGHGCIPSGVSAPLVPFSFAAARGRRARR